MIYYVDCPSFSEAVTKVAKTLKADKKTQEVKDSKAKIKAPAAKTEKKAEEAKETKGKLAKVFNRSGTNQHAVFKGGQAYKRKRPAQPVSHLSLGNNKACGSAIKPMWDSN